MRSLSAPNQRRRLRKSMRGSAAWILLGTLVVSTVHCVDGAEEGLPPGSAGGGGSMASTASSSSSASGQGGAGASSSASSSASSGGGGAGGAECSQPSD